MNDAFTMDLKQMGRPSPRTSDASTLRDFTRLLDGMAAKVRDEWEELPPKEREAYKHLAYAMVEPTSDKQGGLRGLYLRARSAWHLFVIALKDEQEAYVEYMGAFHRFTEAVLDAVESEDPVYQQELVEALEEGLPREASKAMTLEEAREWRRQLRHQVLD